LPSTALRLCIVVLTATLSGVGEPTVSPNRPARNAARAMGSERRDR
jgi:hypothetical protein